MRKHCKTQKERAERQCEILAILSLYLAWFSLSCGRNAMAWVYSRTDQHWGLTLLVALAHCLHNFIMFDQIQFQDVETQQKHSPIILPRSLGKHPTDQRQPWRLESQTPALQWAAWPRFPGAGPWVPALLQNIPRLSLPSISHPHRKRKKLQWRQG